MLFENFSDEAEESARRRRASVALIFLALAVYGVAACIYLLTYKTEAEKRRAAAVREKSVDALCSRIQPPPSFSFVGHDEAVSDDSATVVVYKYHSFFRLEEIPLQHQRFIEQFEKARWHLAKDNSSTFRIGNQTVSLLENATDFANYEIRCAEEEIDFGWF